ncbi:hypothetical protein IC230_10440 [Spirosoma sp. BT704]|uniref:O-antigen ligase domain-containing protein n=1 Tax=Spirosoma validum TaxID=2771355 RepID=A0A927GD50_9BACT|nr:hypothetical protein [Spirosoma validum]
MQRTDLTTRRLKQAIWTYFILLIFEGALRKWFLPSLATPLLIVREPIALWAIGLAMSHNRLKANGYLTGMIWIGVIGMLTALTIGHGNLLVTLYGARILLIHFPFMFLIANVFGQEDIVKLGKVTLLITIPMTVLITMQFYSPQSAWVNLGVAGDKAGAGFDGALGYYRPPATFSFTNGTSLFYSLAACFVFYFWLYQKEVNRLILIGSTLCLIAAIPLSISRALFLQVGVTALFTFLAVGRNPKYIGRLLLAIIGFIIALALLNQTDLFKISIEAFTARFEGANDAGGGFKGAIVDRFIDGLVNSLFAASDQSLFGYGLGMGTNVGAQLLVGTRSVFLISEGEWGRLTGELGSLLGIGVIFIRISLAAKCTSSSYKRIQSGDFLPWILLSNGLLLLLQGGWAQPTSLGFCTLVSGLLLASLRA